VGRYAGLAGVSRSIGKVRLPAEELGILAGFPERNVILLVTFIVILVTLVGHGLTLPFVMRRAAWDGRELEGDELTLARSAAYAAGLEELARSRVAWNSRASCSTGSSHASRTGPATSPPRTRTRPPRRQERQEHEAIQLGIINAQGAAVIDLRDRGEINDQTLRSIVHELDLEEHRTALVPRRSPRSRPRGAARTEVLKYRIISALQPPTRTGAHGRQGRLSMAPPNVGTPAHCRIGRVRTSVQVIDS